MLDKIIIYSFYLLFFLTPLFWTSLNYELFEFNKMILVYLLTTIIVGAWVLKIINSKLLIFKSTPLDIPLLLFLGANILSTIFSTDTYTSIWGYYSRSNGGLLSLISYLLLYFAFVSNITPDKIKRLLQIGLIAGCVISLWGIMEHFGVSPSCVILRGEFSADCWVQDVQARVFATLGQPNWMAGYLGMLIFPALYFFLTSKTTQQRVTYYILLITYYLAFTFTYSRGPTLGLAAGVLAFLFFSINFRITNLKELALLIIDPYHTDPAKKVGFTFKSLFNKPLFIVFLSFLVINLLFGSALTTFRLVSKFAAPPRPSITLPTSNITQLENGGTESGQIRLIVWKGALDIFRNYPIFGSGVETFAYIYYQFRPASHNLTSEWDFLYNKAHNEYLNYLATTGIVGFGTYILIIGAFLSWGIKYYVSGIKQKNHNTDYLILTTSLLASYISYLIYNFFLFSVVILALFFYLFPAIVFVATGTAKPLTKLPPILHSTFYILHFIYRRPIYTKAAKGIVIFFALYFLFSIGRVWVADVLFNLGKDASDQGSSGTSYYYLTSAIRLNNNPFYKSELGYASAQASAARIESEATLSALLKEKAEQATEEVLRENPKNVSFLRTAVRTYFMLGNLDKKYIDKTLETLDKAITLAPTDPKLYYNKALILESLGKKDESIKTLQVALELKPDYLEVLQQLEEATRSNTFK